VEFYIGRQVSNSLNICSNYPWTSLRKLIFMQCILYKFFNPLHFQMYCTGIIVIWKKRQYPQYKWPLNTKEETRGGGGLTNFLYSKCQKNCYVIAEGDEISMTIIIKFFKIIEVYRKWLWIPISSYLSHRIKFYYDENWGNEGNCFFIFYFLTPQFFKIFLKYF
jgi:hypothetical protein